MKDSIINWIHGFYNSSEDGVQVFNQERFDQQSYLWSIGLFVAMVLFSLLLWTIARFLMLRILYVVIDRTDVVWDDYLVENKVFKSLAHIVPLLFMEYFLSIVFYQFPEMNDFWVRIVHVLIILALMVTVRRVLNALRDIVQVQERYSDKPIKSYFQAIKIILSGIFCILMLSAFFDRSPLFFLTSLGAMAAILLLVFKDTILGFVASVQIAANDMVRIGDWITVEKYGADGSVIEISVAAVKVQNFDNTITTIPTYSMISESFKNWRGMQESEGRRIKRAVSIQIESIGFASENLIATLKESVLMRDFIHAREDEIERHNQQLGLASKENINSRRQTNIGIYRKYIEFYLQNNPHINSDLDVMVRQLPSTELGVPLEIYCFTKEKKWIIYESVVSDIFDHIFAITPLFELSIFENPTGADLREIRR